MSSSPPAARWRFAPGFAPPCPPRVDRARHQQTLQEEFLETLLAETGQHDFLDKPVLHITFGILVRIAPETALKISYGHFHPQAAEPGSRWSEPWRVAFPTDCAAQLWPKTPAGATLASRAARVRPKSPAGAPLASRAARARPKSPAGARQVLQSGGSIPSPGSGHSRSGPLWAPR